MGETGLGVNTIQEHLALFSVVPRDIPESQRSEMHSAFYAGAEAVLRILWDLGDERLNEEEGMRLLDSLHEECRGFRQRKYEKREAVSISLVWPYWQRQAVADRSCELLAKHYADLDFELVVVDDGNAEPYRVPDVPFPVLVVRLSTKTVPLNPCVPLNYGVAAARGEIIALSGPDIMHTTPVLEQMREELGDDKKKYVLAAVWYPEKKRWHCHSSYKRSDAGDVGSMLPPGSDYHFMTMLHRSLWDAAGGFDDDYRQGAGYDDPDFVLRLNRAGAKFLMRDDLVVEHVRADAHALWTPEMFSRNRAIFMSKWE